jgi:nicotinamidase-related amidase
VSTMHDRPRTALLVVDVQNGVVAGAVRRGEVIGNVAHLVEAARKESVPVVWVQHSDDGLAKGSEEWNLVPELVPAAGEALVHKEFGDSFEATDLGSVLEAADVGHVVVVGAQSDACIRSTIHGAFTRGYDVTLVSDAHTTEDLTDYGAPPPEQVIAHTNLYWSFQSAPGRTARTVPTAEVAFDG